jgi:hypothetical protein
MNRLQPAFDEAIEILMRGFKMNINQGEEKNEN